MHARIQAARENESGFTLVELLIVIVILGVLAGIVVFSVSGITNNSTVAACKSDLASTRTAVEAFRAQTGAYPATASDALRIGELVSANLIRSAPPASELMTLSLTGAVASGLSGCVA